MQFIINSIVFRPIIRSVAKYQFYLQSSAAINSFLDNPASIYLFKVSNRNTRTMCEICSKLTIKTPEEYLWFRSAASIADLERLGIFWKSSGVFRGY